MTTRIGIISDTHLNRLDEDFIRRIDQAFHSCNTIIHAGDITDLTILNVFSNKEILAVHGNMCNAETQTALPESRVELIEGYRIAICHGAGSRHDIEERLFERFPDTDCIVYGHTHQPVCHRVGTTLFINPGSFIGTGPYGSPGTFALLEINGKGLNPTLCETK